MNFRTRKGLVVACLALIFMRCLVWYVFYTMGWTNEGRSDMKLRKVKKWKKVLSHHVDGSTVTDEWLAECAQRVGDSVTPAFDPGLLWQYALGDCVKMCNNRGGLLYPYTSFKNEYYRKACPSTNPNYVFGGNLTTLKSIMDKRDGRVGFEKPPEDAVVIHLRLGDIIERMPNITNVLQHGDKAPKHPGYVRSAHQYIKEITWTNATKVLLVGGAHSWTSQKSRIYSGCLYEALLLSGFDTYLRTDGYGPDEDFYFMSHAQQFMLATGGYSRLAGQMVTEYGGRIVGTNIWSNDWNDSVPSDGIIPRIEYGKDPSKHF